MSSVKRGNVRSFAAPLLICLLWWAQGQAEPNPSLAAPGDTLKSMKESNAGFRIIAVAGQELAPWTPAYMADPMHADLIGFELS